MSPATPRISQGIIDLVIDQAQSDSATLHSLSLVSKASSLRTRGHLFHDIELSAEWQCYTLESLFDERPSLRQCIKSLTIRVTTSYNWLNENPSEAILAILPLLKSLTRFSMLGKFEPSGSLEWKRLSPKVQIALYEVMARPRVTSITLSYISDVNVVRLMEYGHLEELVLDVVKTGGYRKQVKRGALLPLDAFPSPIPVRTCLRRLEVTTSPGAFRALLLCSTRSNSEVTLDLSNLTYLKVSTSNFPQEFKDADWNSLFDVCGASIESYTVHQIACRKPLPSAIIPLYRFPNLKEFIFMIDYQTIEQQGHNSFPAFVEALDRLSQADNGNHLTTIRVEYDGCAKYIEKEIDELLDGQRWSLLDQTVQRPAFLRLREVKFGFTPRCCRGIFWEENWGKHSGRISSQLPNLNRRGILTLTRSL
ncbi:hypothetical protein EST38_g2369 [Candolleomyces aberdarensis]|uniref:F-box domain-containing protein n=1 Tax=Candolleomyces aberdarensis TaxID=2316362 RepID=A0A4Q2DSJ5_9AGAR|nr:hypothetical protein EST38_g2369 [Candolleomyces aberdarensis]